MISKEMVKALRERTGAGVLDCKRALEETGGDLEGATRLLRQRGLAIAAKKAGRLAQEGLVEAYIHAEVGWGPWWSSIMRPISWLGLRSSRG